jgi:hypothetical protein
MAKVRINTVWQYSLPSDISTVLAKVKELIVWV